eukprot:s194_g55.t1
MFPDQDVDSFLDSCFPWTSSSHVGYAFSSADHVQEEYVPVQDFGASKNKNCDLLRPLGKGDAAKCLTPFSAYEPQNFAEPGLEYEDDQQAQVQMASEFDFSSALQSVLDSISDDEAWTWSRRPCHTSKHASQPVSGTQKPTLRGSGEGNLDLTLPQGIPQMCRCLNDTLAKDDDGHDGWTWMRWDRSMPLLHSESHRISNDNRSPQSDVVAECSLATKLADVVGNFSDEDPLLPISFQWDRWLKQDLDEPVNARKRCRFESSIEVLCFQDDNVLSFNIIESEKEKILRCFWHLHGQITTWTEIQNTILRSVDDCWIMTVPRSPQQGNVCSDVSVRFESDEYPMSLPSAPSGTASAHVENAWWIDVQEAMMSGRNFGSRMHIVTWFLSHGRFHMSLRPRDVPLDEHVDLQSLGDKCRSVWRDLDDGHDVSFHVVRPKPPGLPSTVAHVILIQGGHEDHLAILYYGTHFPILQRLRAVLFPAGETVEIFFHFVQHPDACRVRQSMCYVRFQQDGEDVLVQNHEQLRPPFAALLEGGIRVLEPDSEPSEVDELTEGSDTSSAQATTLPDDEHEEDWEDASFVSGGPQMFQLDVDNPYPWETDAFDEPPVNAMHLEEAQVNVQFAPDHQGHLQNEIEQLMNLEDEDDTPWLAVTFGLGLTDLGCREIQFQPHDLEALIEDILQTWRDHAAYGDLILYNVHPQPIDRIGPRAVAILVVVDLPESMDDSIRHVLVIEQSSGEVPTHHRPYGARLTSEASDREIMAQLSLHTHCPPFALRHCHVRLGTVSMERKVFYEFEHGTLCRTWIGTTYPEVGQAEEYIHDAESFFLRVMSMNEAQNAVQNVVCRIHGISPENVPLGSRDVVIPIDWIFDLQWVQEFQAIWPFAEENSQIFFVSAMTTDSDSEDDANFHFIIKFGLEHGTPILIQQQIIPVDQTIRETQGANEFWAVSIPSGAIHASIVQSLSGWPFWFRFLREQNNYPHLSVNGERLISTSRDWRPGDLLRARTMVWEQSQVLSIMLGTAQSRFDVEPEFTSFLQQDFRMGPTMTQNGVSVSCHPTPFMPEDATDAKCTPTLRDCWRGNVDPPESQGRSPVMVPFLREGLRGNVDPLDSQGIQQKVHHEKTRNAVHEWRLNGQHISDMLEHLQPYSWGVHDRRDLEHFADERDLLEQNRFTMQHCIEDGLDLIECQKDAITSQVIAEDDGWMNPNLQRGTVTLNIDEHVVGVSPRDTLQIGHHAGSKFACEAIEPVDVPAMHDHSQHDRDRFHEVHELKRMLLALEQSPWQGLNQCFELIPDMHPFAKIASEITGNATTADIIHIYTDGSCGKSSAAWAFVVINECRRHGKSRFDKLGFATAMLDTDIGPMRNCAADAEATAIIASADYLMGCSWLSRVEVRLHFDALAIGNFAFGSGNYAECEDGLSHRQKHARNMISIVQSRTKACQGLHVHAHRGQPWNEMADSIATATRLGWVAPIQPMLRCGPLLAHTLIDFAWIEAQASDELPGLIALLENPVPRPASGLYDACLKLQNPVQGNSEDTWVSRLRCATVNVGTLHSFEHIEAPGIGHKVQELMMQFRAAKLHFVALQETRGRDSCRLQVGPYQRLVSAGVNGQCGVELWIDTDAMSQLAGTRIQVTSDVCTWHSTPRIMATTVHWGSLVLEIITCYAPQKGRQHKDIEEFWAEVDHILHRCTTGASIFLLGDFNCRIGSVETAGIGAANPDFEDFGGELCRQVCDTHDLCIPSTMPDLHAGDPFTYTGPQGARSRIDFIAISQHMRNGVVTSFVDPDIDVLNGDRDHSALVTHLDVQFTSCLPQGFQKKTFYDRHEARKAKAEGHLDALQDFPLQSWDLDVNDHWNQMRTFLQEKCKSLFPLPKRQPRQLYFEPHTWELLCQKKELRQQHRALEKETSLCRLAMFFQAWKCQDGLHQSHSEIRFRLHVALMQEAVILEARRRLIKNFKQCKQKDWKNWVQKQLQDKVANMRNAKGSEIYRILKPKRMIDAKCGKLRKQLPGFLDGNGVWQASRPRIAAAWQAQFAGIENADSTTFEELLAKSQPVCHQLTCAHLQQVPTLMEVERALRALSESKAAGLDGLGSEIYQGNIATSAKRVYPLVMKMFTRQQGIAEHTGGWLVPLYKGKGSMSSMTQYRAILLEATLARAISKSWRSRLAEGVHKIAQPLQFGGRKGLSIEALHLQTRLWQMNAQKQHVSLGLVFVDIQSAFYSVVKQMIAGFNGSEDSLVHLFMRMNLPASALEEFISNVGQGDILERATGSRLLAAGTGANLAHTWFAVQNGNALQAPATGSRPGDPNADLLFTFIMSKIIGQIRHRASEAGISLDVETEFGPVVNYAAWVDDVAFAVFADAVDVVSKTAHLLSIIVDTMTEHAMRLSFGPGKTAILFEFHGKDAVKERQRCEQIQQDKLPLLSEHFGQTSVHLTNKYKYLGGFLVRGGGCLQEIRTRKACALRNLRPLKKVLSNTDIDIQHRRTLIRSMGLSVYTLHSGTWHAMNQGEYQAWHAGLHQLYQILSSRNEDGQVKHDDMYSLAYSMRAPMPMELLYINRLRLLFHLIRAADKHIIAAILHNHMIATNDSWLYGAIKSVQWLQTQLGSEVVPDELMELHHPGTWSMFSDAHKDLHKMLRQVEQAHLLRLQTYCSLKEHQNKQNELLRAMNWICHSEVVKPVQTHQCEVCDMTFKDQAALAAHQQRKHGHRIAMRFLAADDVCRACKRKYHTRPRLLQHLHNGQTDCWIWHLRKYQPMSSEQMMLLDDKDRQAGVAMHQHGFKSEKVDKAWRQCTETELHSTLVCRILEDPGMHDPTEEEISSWSQIGLLPVGRGGRTKTCRSLQEFQIENVVRDTSVLEKQMLHNLDAWEPSFEWVPRPLALGTKYFLVFFSGHRRFGDISSWFEWGSDIKPIAVDLAIDQHFGDILRDNLWVRLIESRKVVGCHSGPPCETFTEARWLPPEQGVFPRPLRDQEEPWCMSNRTIAEVMQCTMGTILMLRALFLSLLTFIFGGSTTLEHPRGSIQEDLKWCIWRSAFVKQLCKDKDINIITFLQGPLGRPYAKPTNLLSGRLHSLAFQIFAAYDSGWRPTQVLGGRHNGQWRTMQAKEYPVKMCEILAKAHMQHAATIAEEGFEEIPEGIHAALEALCGHFDPYMTNAKGTSMQADYHRAKAPTSMPSKA